VSSLPSGYLLTGERESKTNLQQEEISLEQALSQGFSVTSSLYQLYRVDYRIRFYIFEALKAKATIKSEREDERRKVREQLALCFTFGFGTPRDPAHARIILEANPEPKLFIETAINQIREQDYHEYHSPIIDQVPGISIASVNFSHHYQEANVLSEAESTYKREIGDLESVIGLDHIIVSMLRSDLAKIIGDQGRWKEAEDIQQDVLDRSRNIYGNNRSVLQNLNSLGCTYSFQGKWKLAEAALGEASEIAAKDSKTDTTKLMIDANIASIYRSQGKWNYALQMEEQILGVISKQLGWEHPQTLSIMSNLATTYRKIDDLDEAMELEEKVLETRKKVLGLEHPDTLLTMSHIALTYSSQERYVKALETELEVQKLYSKVLPEDHPTTLYSLGNLALHRMKLQHWDKAEQLLIKIIEKKTKNMGSNHPSTLMSKLNMASVYYQQKRFVESTALHRYIYERRESDPNIGPNNPDTLDSLHNLGTSLWKQGLGDEARVVLKKCYNAKEMTLGAQHSSTRATLEELANTN